MLKQILILIIALHLAYGASIFPRSVSSRSTSYWVFWYYSDTGERSCGNYCYLVFALVGAILLCSCGCGCLRCYLIRKRYRDEEKFESSINTQQIFDQWEQEARAAEQQQRQTHQQLQYPPLAHTHNNPNIPNDNIPPPSYDNNNTYNAELHKHALRQESNWSAYKAGKQFTRDNPPMEVLPPQEHLNYIKESGGVEPWKFVPESSILQLNLASVTNDHILSFHAKLDAMVQTNYPLLDMEYPKSSANNTLSGNVSENQKSNNLSEDTSAFNINHNNGSSNNISPMTIDSNLHLLSPNSPFSSNSPLPPSSTITNTNMIIDVASASSQPLPPSYTSQPIGLQPPTNSLFYYYEITIVSNPDNDKTIIAIGLATKPYPAFRLTGCNSNSVGYHSNEGKKFHNDGLTGTKYAEKWGEIGDVIGCGYYPSTGQVFFTKNGKNLGIAYTGLFHVWFPTIGSDGVCSLKVNFGQDGFRFRRANGMSVAGIIPQNIISQDDDEESIEEENMI